MEYSIYGYVVFYIVFSALNGSIVFAVWMLTEKALRKYLSAHVSVIALEICLICFLVPVIYVKCLYQFIIADFRTQYMMFDISPDLYGIFRLLALLWLSGFCIMVIIYLRTKILFERRLRAGSVSETDEKILALLEEYKRKLSIHRKVMVLRNNETKSAFVYGSGFVHVVLPQGYAQEEESLRVILLHELIHIRRHDILVKHIGNLIRCLFWFHPLAHLIVGRLSDYLEYRCDELCCSAKHGGIGQKEYFSVILRVASQKKHDLFFVYAGFSMTGEQLKRRINYMNRKQNVSGIRKVCVVMAAILALNAGLVTAYAASDSAMKGYDDTNEAMAEQEDMILEDYEKELEMEVINVSGDIDSDILEEGALEEEIIYDAETNSTTVSVTLPPRHRKTISLFMMKNEGVRMVTVIEPSTIKGRMGIIRPNNTRSYVEGKGDLQKTFYAATSDTHKIYVENPNYSGTIKVMLNYRIIAAQ